MIYDCFTFFNELDLLELRLNELDSVVDKFVLVEATKNHQGKDKPLFFEENKKRFEKFLPKIIHIVIKDYPANPTNHSWIYERHQRSMIAEGIKNCKPDDVILVSDIDEIPRPEKILEYKDKIGTKIFLQRMFYYYMNCMNTTDIVGAKKKYSWAGTVMTHFKNISSVQQLRELSIIFLPINHPNFFYRIYLHLNTFFKKMKYKNVTVIEDAGWHFSYLGGVQRIIQKLESFAHDEFNKSEFKDPKKIEETIKNGKDIFGRNFSYRFVQIDSSYPKYLLANREKFNHLTYQS